MAKPPVKTAGLLALSTAEFPAFLGASAASFDCQNAMLAAEKAISHVIARTGRVARDGTYEILSMGSIRPACRRIDAARSTATEIGIDIDAPEPLTPGVAVALSFSLTPQPVVLRPGERLRLDIGSRTDLLRSDVSHGHPQSDMQVPPYFSRNTLHYGPDSFLELTVANSSMRSSE
ncbi:CocE/NonD family hydrolase C-terminal non-catalytic domain-containing protein [Methylocapsa palsarum]|uniref:Xaa-Pro dipeptidyl-peptidase C-terminal domain-containing protein n=1 Tax=Methylocapsa palsarum TaxID=1612308 RepID=A0A1I4D0I7_9HYPH|nr:CocE/NonD family hydrolase C-terminal non-catalytic domain-containing protein [Methylocapsa palsarum]SFK86655.1 hypothetical protein SAMN05444581_13316 [Methylocapsa palsarum]